MPLKRSITRAAIAIVTIGLLVFLTRSQALRPWRSRATDLVIPLLSVSRQAGERMSGWAGGASRKRIRVLEEDRNRLAAEVARKDEALRENEILKEALALKQAGELGVIPAKVVGFFRQGRDEFLLLDHGADGGIAVGDIVLNQHRAFGGTVVETGEHFSRVMLLTSPSRNIDVLIGENLKAIARGDNNRELVINLVPQDAEVSIGDVITASPRATGGRASIVVGEVREVKQAENEVFKSVRAIHLFDPESNDVLVLLAS